MSDSKKKIYLGEDLVCQTFTDAEEQAKAFDLFGLEQPVVSSNAPASTRPVQQGQVCEFDGVNDYILLPNTIGKDFSGSCWIKFDEIATQQGIYNHGNTVNHGFVYLTAGVLRIIGGSSIVFAQNAGTVTAGVWHFIEWELVENSHLICWLDGVASPSVALGSCPSASNVRSIGTHYSRTTNWLNGSVSNFTINDNQYNLNHASGTTAYDSSGNGNDGTLENGAAFVVDNTLPPEADRLNLEGYTDDSGVLKPRDESDPTKDIDGNTLQYSGSVYPRRPEYRNSYAASFDGVDDKILIDGTPYASKTKGKITGYFKTASSGVGTICAFTDESDPASDLRILVNSGKLALGIRNNSSNSFNASTVATFNDGSWHLFEISCTDSGITLTVDGDVQSVTYAAGNASTKKWISDVDDVDMFAIGVRQESSPDHYFDGEIAGITLFDEDGTSIIAQYPLTEGAGDTVYDISGNGNHGTINNASTGTEGAGFWAGRIDGEANALNNNNGFSKRMLFDGVDDEVELPNDAFNAQSAGYIEADVLCVGGGNYTVFGVASSNTSNQILSMQILDTNKIRVGYGGANFVQGTTVLTSGERYRIKWESTGTEWKIYIDGVEETTNVQTGSNTGQWFDEITSGSTRYSVGLLPRSTGNSSMFKGTVYNLIINNGTADIASYNGYGNTDADWTDQIGSNNGTVNGSPALLRIPADTSEPTKDVLGDTLTNPAITDGYNGAETEFDAYNIAEGGNPSPATNNNSDLDAIGFGTDFATNDAAFMRLKSSTENDRLITFEDDLTGGDETLAQKYTQ